MAVVSSLELYSWIKFATSLAVANNVPIVELDWLLQVVAGLDKLTLRLLSESDALPIELNKSLKELSELWNKRIQGHPIQYVVGFTHWRNFTLKVSSDVLIPRPETECLIDIVNKASLDPYLSSGHWVDLGTGSGAIAIGLADLFTNATIQAVDSSAAALAIAAENAANLGFADRIKFYQGSWWSPLEAFKGQISGMVSNPPYIPKSLILQLQKEVVNYEPHLALDGGEDGLEHIRHLVKTAPDYLKPGGIWLIEMMQGQAQEVAKMLQAQGSYEKIQIIPDLAKIDRFAVAYRC